MQIFCDYNLMAFSIKWSFFGLLALGSPCAFLFAGIQWQTKAVILNLTPDQSFVDVSYPFKNESTDPVSILKVDTSCGCMTPSKVTGDYKAGDSGVLKVRYRVGSKLGTIVEAVTVHTSDKSDETVNLRMTINIPISFRIEPEFVFWDIGEAAESRDAYFLDLSGSGMKPVAVYSPDTNFTATIVPQPEQHRYALRVTPLSTDSEEGSNIFVDIDVGGGKIRKTRFVAAVRSPNVKKFRLNQ
jgi:hypothetical protein